jgi:hypothetical protein
MWASAIGLCIGAAGADSEAGFVSLFNGKDLTGWQVTAGPAESFAVIDGLLTCTGKGHYPTWLRSETEYENFVLRFEYIVKHYSESGLLIHAPLHGRLSRVGFKVEICDDWSRTGRTVPTGSIQDIARARAFDAKKDGQWNRMEVVMDYPMLRVTLNDQLIQEIDCATDAELRYRLRRGYLGIQDLGRYIAFRHIRIKELPAKEPPWTDLLNSKDLAGWSSLGPAKWEIKNGAVGASGHGYLLTENAYQDFELFTYIRTSRYANGGIFFRWKSHDPLRERGYEAQIYNMVEATNPTGSIYAHVRAEVMTSRDGEWFPMQIFADGPRCVIRVNGETVAVADKLELVRPGRIALQIHHKSARVEWKGLRIKPLDKQ